MPDAGREATPEVYGATLALAYWSQHIRPTLGDLPMEGLRFLRDQYVRDVEQNPEAQRQLIDWWYSR